MGGGTIKCVKIIFLLHMAVACFHMTAHGHGLLSYDSKPYNCQAR